MGCCPPPICPSTLNEGIHLGSSGSLLGASLPIELRSQLCSSRCVRLELCYPPSPLPSDWRPWWSVPVLPTINVHPPFSVVSSVFFWSFLVRFDSALLLCLLPAPQTLLVQCDPLTYCGTLAVAGYCPKYLGNLAQRADESDFDLKARKARMTTCVQILEGSSVPGCPLPRCTKSREGVLNRLKGTKRVRPDAAVGGEVPTATYRRKRRCANLGGPETAEITKPQAFSPIPREPRVEQRRIQRATSGPNPAVLNDGSSSPFTTGPSTSAADNGLPDPDLLCSKNSTSRSSQDITTAQDDEEDENELPSLDSLLGLDFTRPHSDSEDALNQRSLTESVFPTQGSAEVPGPISVSILQESSDHEFDAQAPLTSDAAFAPEDKQVLTSGSNSTSKRSGHGTGKCSGCGADVPPLSKRRRKRLSARQQRAFCEAHKRKDKLEAAKTEWALCGYPRIDWQKLDARLQTFSPALCGILRIKMGLAVIPTIRSDSVARLDGSMRCASYRVTPMTGSENPQKWTIYMGMPQ